MSEPPPVECALRDALIAAGMRPADDAEREDKRNYAQRLSTALAVEIARRLRPAFPDVRPTPEEGHETAMGAAGGTKRLDVCVWHDRLGLLLDVSIKTYSFRDFDRKKKRLGRMTKNVVRNDMELLAEASKVHERQPYAVLVGLMFVPVMACDDGERGRSSFAHMVETFRKRTGRDGHDDKRYDRFEAFYLGLYESDGDRRGSVRFFDVEEDPPRNGKPRRDSTLSFDEVTVAIKDLVDRRNSKGMKWAEPDAEAE